MMLGNLLHRTLLICGGCSTARTAILRPRTWLGSSSVTRLLAIPKKGGLLVNEEIETDKIRLVIKDTATGKSTSTIVTRTEALTKARSAGLDLVLVSNASEPWVCKLVDVAREKYAQVKKEKRQGKKAPQLTKELTIRGNIGEHDLLIKLRRATEFFGQGHAVRLTLVPSGMQMRTKPKRLQELRDFIVDEYFVDKCKSITEVQPPPPNPDDPQPLGSQKREIILYPKRAAPPQQQKGGGKKPAASGGGGDGGGGKASTPSGEETNSGEDPVR